MPQTFQGAAIEEQGNRFAVVIVTPAVMNDPNKSEARRLIAAFELKVFGVPVVLMAQDAFGTPTYYGRQDIVDFLSEIPIQNIPWKEFTLTP